MVSVLAYYQACEEIERLEVQRVKLREALEGVMADISGGEKPCGHDFTCVCAGDKARAALKATEEG